MKIEIPKKIAICLIGGDKAKSIKQKNSIINIENKFNIEWYLRSDIYTGEYWTYSQIINEAVISTESEFMIFVNPKTSIKEDDIIEIITDLCSGYCWVGLVSFGLWGTTKELFRHIGLMDERFLSSEYEDNDFGLRLKKFGKAIKWFHRNNQYENINSVRRKLYTHSIFYKKWLFDSKNKIAYLNTNCIENKQLPIHIKSNCKKDISDSWMDNNSSLLGKNSHVIKMHSEYEISDKELKVIKQLDIINIKIKYDGEFLEGNYNGNKHNFITLTCIDITKNDYAFKFGKALSWYNNTDFKSESIIKNKPITITLIHEGSIIYDNQLVFPPFNLDINLGLSITNFMG